MKSGNPRICRACRVQNLDIACSFPAACGALLRRPDEGGRAYVCIAGTFFLLMRFADGFGVRELLAQLGANPRSRNRGGFPAPGTTGRRAHGFSLPGQRKNRSPARSSEEETQSRLRAW